MSADPKFRSRRVSAGLYVITREDRPDLEVDVIFRSKKKGFHVDGWQAIAQWSPHVFSDFLERKKFAVEEAHHMITHYKKAF